MRCADIERLCTAYVDGEVDGELDERRASAMRGHMRTCAACLALVEDEAALISAAERLEPVEPPAELWARIEQDLGRREIADSQRSSWWLAWPRVRQAALPAAVLAAAALAVVSYSSRSNVAPTTAERTAVAAPSQVPRPAVASATPRPGEQFRTVRSAQIRAAEHDYLKTIGELEGLAAEARADWNAPQQAKYRRAMDRYRSALRTARNGLADHHGDATIDPVAHDPLIAVYQGRIRYLQRVSFGEVL